MGRIRRRQGFGGQETQGSREIRDPVFTLCLEPYALCLIFFYIYLIV